MENKLVDEWILFQSFQCLLELLLVEMTASVREDSESAISLGLIVTENVIAKREVWISKFIRWKRFVILNFEVTMNWFGELNQRQRFPWEHVWLCHSDCVVLLVLLEAIHQILELDAVLVFKQWH